MSTPAFTPTDSPGQRREILDEYLQRQLQFLGEVRGTPCLAIDLGAVEANFFSLKTVMAQAEIYYAVKANPHPAVLRRLVDLGSKFDVASPAEIDLVLEAGAAPEEISYGNTVKTPLEIAHAHFKGVELFVFDTEDELRKIAASAPGASVYCRIAISNDGARWPLGRKFGCSPDAAVNLLALAKDLDVDPCGVSFHVGSQQLEASAWERGIGQVAEIFDRARQQGVGLSLINLGGGFPAHYDMATPGTHEYGKAINAALHEAFGDIAYRILIEPGRGIVGDAGVLRTKIKAIRDEGGVRWVYLDVGRFGGLAETENGAIRYRLYTHLHETALEDTDGFVPVTLAGPTCDSADVLYEEIYLPRDLQPGDYVYLRSAGAYTSVYASSFNGFSPISVHCFEGEK